MPLEQRSLIHREAYIWVDQEYPKTHFFLEKTEKLIQNIKTQKRLEICQN